MKFSTKFPSKHPKEGQPTYFVEKILNSLEIDFRNKEYLHMLIALNKEKNQHLLQPFFENLNHSIFDEKIHTIRVDTKKPIYYTFTPEIWSGKPYNSTPIIFAPKISAKTQIISIYPSYDVYVSINYFGTFGTENIHDLAKNDGLLHNDFRDWFTPSIKKKGFIGQIIRWKGEIY